MPPVPAPRRARFLFRWRDGTVTAAGEPSRADPASIASPRRPGSAWELTTSAPEQTASIARRPASVATSWCRIVSPAREIRVRKPREVEEVVVAALDGSTASPWPGCGRPPRYASMRIDAANSFRAVRHSMRQFGA
jgi:hypothetical protein